MGYATADVLTLLEGGDDVVLTDEYLSRALNVAETVAGIVGQQAVARLEIAMQGAVDLKHGVNGLFDFFLIQLTVALRVEVGQQAKEEAAVNACRLG